MTPVCRRKRSRLYPHSLHHVRQRPSAVNTLAALLPAKIKRRFLPSSGATVTSDFVATRPAEGRMDRERSSAKVRFVPPPLVAPTTRPWIFERPASQSSDRW